MNINNCTTTWMIPLRWDGPHVLFRVDSDHYLSTDEQFERTLAARQLEDSLRLAKEKGK